MSIDPASIALYARIAKEAADLVGNLADSFDREKRGESIPKAEIDQQERKKKRLDKLWADLSPENNVVEMPKTTAKKPSAKKSGGTTSDDPTEAS